MMEVVATAI